MHRSNIAITDFRLKLNKFLFDLVASIPREDTGFPHDFLITPTSVRLGPDAKVSTLLGTFERQKTILTAHWRTTTDHGVPILESPVRVHVYGS